MRKGLENIEKYDHEKYMRVAIEEAMKAAERGDKPIGAVLVYNHEVIGKESNRWNSRKTKVQHAENMLVINNGSFLKEHGDESIIYTTLEPCIMCLSTIIMADIRNIVVGFEDKYMKTRDIAKTVKWLDDRIYNYKMGILREDCEELIKKYGEEEDKRILL